MTYFATRACKIGRQAVAAGADLSAYPPGTLRYLLERGLAYSGTSATRPFWMLMAPLPPS